MDPPALLELKRCLVLRGLVGLKGRGSDASWASENVQHGSNVLVASLLAFLFLVHEGACVCKRRWFACGARNVAAAKRCCNSLTSSFLKLAA